MAIGITLGGLLGCASNVPLAFVFAGESNAGGLALNSSASAGELAAHPSVQIMIENLTFATLDIGSNNIFDHANITDNATYVPSPGVINVHGMELGLVRAVEAGQFVGVETVHLVKTGQGGSTIAQWNDGGAYWTKFTDRTDAAKALLPSNTQWVVWYSQGLNDVAGGTAVATWKTATIAHLAKIKTELPGCVIVMTQFQGLTNNDANYNTAIAEIAAADPSVVAYVAATGAANDGGNHWSYAGFKDTLVPALVQATLGLLP